MSRYWWRSKMMRSKMSALHEALCEDLDERASSARVLGPLCACVTLYTSAARSGQRNFCARSVVKKFVTDAPLTGRSVA